MKIHNARLVLIILAAVMAVLAASCAPAPAAGAWSSISVEDGILYAGSQTGRIFALDATSGGEIWQFPPASEQTGMGAVGGAPVRANDTVYAGASDGRLYAVDANTGSQRWTPQSV